MAVFLWYTNRVREMQHCIFALLLIVHTDKLVVLRGKKSKINRNSIQRRSFTTAFLDFGDKKDVVCDFDRIHKSGFVLFFFSSSNKFTRFYIFSTTTTWEKHNWFLLQSPTCSYQCFFYCWCAAEIINQLGLCVCVCLVLIHFWESVVYNESVNFIWV